MKSRHYAQFPALLLLCLLASAGLADEALNITVASLRYGMSPRIKPGSWAYFNYGVANATESDAKLTLVLRPKDQRNMTIFEEELDLAAGYEYRFRSLVTVGTVEGYYAELYQGGNLVDSEEMVMRIGSPENLTIMFMNDDEDLSFGNFAKNEDIHRRHVTSHTRGRFAPDHWAGYDETDLLVLMQPAYDEMTSRQLNAILDFTARGGTLLLADPTGIMAADRTVLHKLLPVIPLRIRKLDHLASLTSIGGTPVSWPEGEDFLESVTRENCLTTLRHSDFPLVTWRRFGLGYVGVCAVNPSVKEVQASGNFAPLWNHLLQFEGRLRFASSQGSEEIATALDTLTGIEIPPTRLVSRYVVVYFIAMLLAMCFGIVSGLRLTSWLILSALSVVCTAAVFAMAAKRGKDVSPFTSATISWRTLNQEDATVEQITSLFSKSEDQFDIGDGGVNSAVRAMIPPPIRIQEDEDMPVAILDHNADTDLPKSQKNPHVSKGSDEIARDPLIVSLADGAAYLNGVLLRPYAPKFFVSMHEQADAVTPVPTPVVQWSMDGAQLAKPWPVPGGMALRGAALICEEASYTMVVKQGMLQVAAEQGSVLGVAPELAALRKLMVRQPTPAPFIALFTELPRDEVVNLPENFALLGRAIHMVPVLQQLPASVGIPAGRIELLTTGMSRSLRFQDEWRLVQQRKKERLFPIVVVLPPGYSRLQLEQLRVEFVGDNRGRNLTYEWLLQPRDAPEGEQLVPSTQDDDVYTFTGLAERDLVDPTSGTITLVLRSRTVKDVKDPLSAMKVNSWRVKTLRVAVAGQLPAEMAGQF